MPKLPTKDDLKKLPLRAIVAYAARCARRVQPLFVSSFEADMLAVDNAITRAEKFSAGAARVSVGSYDADAAAVRAADRGDDIAAYAAAVAARAAYASNDLNAYEYAANATGDAITDNNLRDQTDDLASKIVDAVFGTRVFVTASTVTAVDIEVASAAVHDYQSLLTLAKGEYPELGEPIDVNDLEPLWPNGKPAGWPEAYRDKKKRPSGDAEQLAFNFEIPSSFEMPSFPFYIDPGDASQKTIQDVFEKLSNLHEALGGSGLEFKMDGDKVYAMEVADQ